MQVHQESSLAVVWPELKMSHCLEFLGRTPSTAKSYNMFQALVDQFECTINDISDNFEAMTAYLYTPEEAINGKALTPRVKERELFIVEAGGKLPTCIEAFTQEFTEGQREVQFLYEFDYQQVPDLELAGAVRGKDHIKYTVPPVETLKMLFNETFDAIQR